MRKPRVFALGAALLLAAAGPGAHAAASSVARGRLAVPIQGVNFASPVAPVLNAPKSFSLTAPTLALTPALTLVPSLAPTAVPLAAPLLSPAVPHVSVTPAGQSFVQPSLEKNPGVTAASQLTSLQISAAQAGVKFDGAAAQSGDATTEPLGTSRPARPLRLLITGPPGSGKGTYAQKIAKDYGVIHISAGELLRQKAKSDPALAAIMNRGDLVPASVVVAAVKERLAQPDIREKGYILDGFPRRLVEAKEFKAMLAGGETLDGAIHLEVPRQELLRRILARGRADDSEAVFRNRMKVYRAETKPAIKEAVRGVPVLRPDVRGPDIETNYAKVKAVLETLWARLR